MLRKWRESSLHNKIRYFTGSLVLIIVLSLLFDGWVAKLLLSDVYQILDENRTSNELVSALTDEAVAFEAYMRSLDDERSLAQLQAAITKTKAVLRKFPSDYETLGELRYLKRWSIENSYEVYSRERDSLIAWAKDNDISVEKLYQVYEMQDYLKKYSQDLMGLTISTGNEAYTAMVPSLVFMPTAIFIVALILLILIIILGVSMRQAIVDPVLSLAEAAKKIASDDFYIEDVVVENKDEIGELTETFNRMKYATGEYIRTIEEKRRTEDMLHEQEREKLEMENELERMKFDVLRSQVNPHFLFNTLNIIAGMATLEDAPKTEAMTQALSNIFRYNLKNQDMEVTLSQEIKAVSDYMYIQKMRFGDRVSFDMECKVDANLYMLPTFTLQPLVENAIIHGLSKKEDGGSISINIDLVDDMLVVSVKDTGVGMTKEQCAELLEEKEHGDNRGMGLGNIIKRIRSMYKDGIVNVDSEPGVGTTIFIKLPANVVGEK